ncbi:MAG TPA: hypothetical protein VH678_29960 [Xanthobacteraceae bacterium]|jgi:hypothetical protein
MSELLTSALDLPSLERDERRERESRKRERNREAAAQPTRAARS